MDKLEVQLQHNHADFSTWEEIEYYMCYMMDKHVLFDETLFELKKQIENTAEQKMKRAGVDTDLVRQRVSRSDHFLIRVLNEKSFIILF